jgi:hypothetical protein
MIVDFLFFMPTINLIFFNLDPCIEIFMTKLNLFNYCKNKFLITFFDINLNVSQRHKYEHFHSFLRLTETDL